MISLFEQSNSVADTKLSEPVKQLSPWIDQFLQDYRKQSVNYDNSPDPKIRVSDVLSSIAYVYERIRTVIEYKGEHVIRRNAIERIIRRLLWVRASGDTHRMAHMLLRELIWARYLPNDTIPRSKIKQISQILSKYIHFLSLLTDTGIPLSGNILREWLWGVASCEIEEALDPSGREPFVTLMFNWFNQYFIWQDKNLSEHEKKVQTYIAIHRALAKSDEAIIRYHLLVLEYPQWRNGESSALSLLAKNFYQVYQEIEKHLQQPLRFRLYRIVKKHVAPFTILKDLVIQEKQNIKTVFNQPALFEDKITQICQVKYAMIQQKVNRGIVRSIIYIFLTKVFFALLIEVPYEIYRIGYLTFLPLIINIIVPPSMMFMIGITIKAPNQVNTQRILAKLKSVIYHDPQPASTGYSLTSVQRSQFSADLFAIIYLLLGLLVFGGITWLLLQLKFTFIGIGVFFIFLSLVLLFGFRVRFTASELKVTSDKEGFFEYIFNNLTLPFLRAGVYLSKGLAKLNFFTVIFDFLIEAPLKSIIEIFEEWTSFIREKREEAVEVPEQ